MSKKYCLYINSQTASNRDTTGGLGAYKYYVNWGAILGTDKSKKYTVEWCLANNPDSTALTASAITVGCNLGSSLCYDQTSSQVNIIGSITPKSYPGTSTLSYFYYQHNITDNSAFTCNYPSNDYITISMQTLAGVTTTSVSNYVIFFYFTEIKD